ncbi:hypothetical protein EP331_10540 [bacterium]|nr:MAG: hypothetical protein EP331_10540 [bacterium]
MYKYLIALFALLISVSSTVHAQRMELADQIVAVVNSRIILKSDIDSLTRQFITEYKQPFNESLWYTLLRAEVEKNVLLEQAKVDSIDVTDDEIDRKLNQRLRMMVRQAGSEEVLENYFGKSIIELKSEWKQLLKNDEIVQKVRNSKMSSVTITKPEIADFFKTIPVDSLPMIPEKVKLAHIVRIPKPNKNAKADAFKKAEAIRDSIVNHGKSIEEMAKKYSDDLSSSNGGFLPLIDINELVPEYSAAAAALDINGISQVVETTYGFHVIRLNKRVGDQISTNHVLIKLNSNDIDEEQAIKDLTIIRDSLLANPAKKFTDAARIYSDDKNTASGGGIIKNPQTGESLIDLKQLDPALFRIVLLLEKPGDISEPKPFTTNPPDSKKAYRIVQLLEHVDEHKASLDQDYALFENYALQQKKEKVFRDWVNKIKKDIYIEYRIDVPKEFQI